MTGQLKSCIGMSEKEKPSKHPGCFAYSLFLCSQEIMLLTRQSKMGGNQIKVHDLLLWTHELSKLGK